MQATFDGMYETRHIIVDRKTCPSVNVSAVLTDRKADEQCLQIIGTDKGDIAIMLIER